MKFLMLEMWFKKPLKETLELLCFSGSKEHYNPAGRDGQLPAR